MFNFVFDYKVSFTHFSDDELGGNAHFTFR